MLPPLSETKARTYLHRNLFDEMTVGQLAVALSYGKRARLTRALLVLRGANRLVLDEPYNHLNPSSRERFKEPLTGFAGPTIAVLHDRYAIGRFATRIVELRDGHLTEQSALSQSRVQD